MKYVFNPFTGTFDAISIEDLTPYVPYTGATGGVDLGSENLETTGDLIGGLLDINNVEIDGNTLTCTGDFNIRATGGDVDFDNENIDTTGEGTFGKVVADAITIDSNEISSVSSTIDYNNNNFVDVGDITCTDVYSGGFGSTPV